MTFRIETTAEAEQDAEAVLEWLLAQHAGDTGISWFMALEDAIASLAEFPERCPLAPENAPHVYGILFTIAGNTVYILHIRHGARQPLQH